MELQSPSAAKKLWSFLRLALFMMRKGLISKRKLIMDMNLMMNCGKLIGKSLVCIHQPSSHSALGHHHHDYQFSCTNSPNPASFRKHRRQVHHYFPCINAPNRPQVMSSPTVKYTEQSSSSSLGDISPSSDDEVDSMMVMMMMHTTTTTTTTTPGVALPSSSVRVSNYSSNEEDGATGGFQKVDHDAEEFIRRFYEQLRMQSRIALLQYQEMEYQQMIARGTT